MLEVGTRKEASWDSSFSRRAECKVGSTVDCRNRERWSMSTKRQCRVDQNLFKRHSLCDCSPLVVTHASSRTTHQHSDGGHQYIGPPLHARTACYKPQNEVTSSFPSAKLRGSPGRAVVDQLEKGRPARSQKKKGQQRKTTEKEEKRQTSDMCIF